MKHWVTWTIGFFGLCKIQHLFKWPKFKKKNWMLRFSQTTIDGSEIQRSPVDVGSLSHVFSHYLQGLTSIQTVETAKKRDFWSQQKTWRVSGPVGKGHRPPKVKRISCIKAATRRRKNHDFVDRIWDDNVTRNCHCTLQGMDTYPTKREVRKIIDSKCHFWGIC